MAAVQASKDCNRVRNSVDVLSKAGIRYPARALAISGISVAIKLRLAIPVHRSTAIWAAGRGAKAARRREKLEI
jgi:hypothetical protein